MVSACGGQTICSTCKVEVLEGLDHLEPRTPEEVRNAERFHWPDSIRLGCTTRFRDRGKVKIKRLVKPPGERKVEKTKSKTGGLGVVRSLAILFVDLKGFAPLSESIPALDLMYILNRYFTALKEEIVKNHGTINLWAGDELSCVLCIQETDSGSYCEDAVKTAFAIRKRILVLSEALRKEFNRSVDVGIGIHYGPTVVGNIGPVDDLRFGHVGDCVNVASRIERKTRDLNSDILISQDVWDNLTESCDLFQEKHEVPLKGVSQMMTVYSARIPV